MILYFVGGSKPLSEHRKEEYTQQLERLKEKKRSNRNNRNNKKNTMDRYLQMKIIS